MKFVAVVLSLAFAFSASDCLAVPHLLNLSGNNFSTAEPQAIGEELKIVGHLSQSQDNSPIALPGILDWSTEYTVYISGLVLDSPPGDFARTFTGGEMVIYSEAPPNSPWTPLTPVANIPALNPGEVPSTFIDGNLLLRGNFSAFVILDFTQFPNVTVGNVSNTDIDWVAGSALPDLQGQGIENDWAWNGWFDTIAPVPPGGYLLLYGGKIEREQVTPVEPATWGQIKASLR